MIEAYALLAAFTVQILAMSVLCPVRLIRYVRAQSTSIPAERFAQLYPGVDFTLTLERYVTRYRVLNTGIAVLGLLPLGWLFNYMWRPDWDDGPVEAVVAMYFMVQALPLGLVALIGVMHRKALKPLLLEGKRTAVLQRRGLFDFVSPFTVLLAVLSYFLFAAYVIYIAQNPFPGFKGDITIGGITLVYALNAFGVYRALYGRKLNPYETHASRVNMIGLTVRACVYSCILCVVFLSLNFTLVLLELQRWEPFAQSVLFVVCAILSFSGFTAPPRQPEADGLGESPVS
jgi:hypothetical protein